MKVHFYLHYATKFGESFSLCLPGGQRYALEYLNEDFWHGCLDLVVTDYPEGLSYSYELHSEDGLTKPEADPGRRLDLSGFESDAVVYDYFNPMGLLENVFTTQPFRKS